MYKLSSLVIIILFGFISAWGQSPHGKDFIMDCAKCHSPENWTFNKMSKTFSHDSTTFPLKGQHIDLDCRLCHTSLEFKQAGLECISCHTDVHQQTVGHDCARCHTPKSWIVENISQIHEKVSFPLMGAHAIINCNDCHKSETNLRFSPIGAECIDCHRDDYYGTKMPDHIKRKFGNDCASCHSLNGIGWNTEKVEHGFFPLEQGHMIKDCATCHATGNYSDISANCISCHQTDFNRTLNPNHKFLGISTDCASCHSTALGWSPAAFPAHNQFYTIAGAHTKIANN